MKQKHIVARHPIPVGGFLAILSLPVHLVLPLAWSHALAAGLLALIGGVYLGFATMDGRIAHIIVEGIVAVLFAAFAMITLEAAPWLLPFGYVLHGVWDTVHHRQILSDLQMPKWYVPLCAIYDVIAGVCLFVIWGFIS